jgi:hypothetical protein
MPLANRYENNPARRVSNSQNGTTTVRTAFNVSALGSVTFGAAGAVASYSLPPGCTVTLGVTGTYAFAGLPQGVRGVFRAFPVQALATANQWRLTAYSASAGTATLVHSSAGSDTDPASGDSVQIETTVESGG